MYCTQYTQALSIPGLCDSGLLSLFVGDGWYRG